MALCIDSKPDGVFDYARCKKEGKQKSLVSGQQYNLEYNQFVFHNYGSRSWI